MVMPYTAIQFTVLQKLKTYAAGSSKAGIFQYEVDYDSEDILSFGIMYLRVIYHT